MRFVSIYALFVVTLAGCSPASRSPDAVRHDTAVATQAVARNAKAVGQGIIDGLRAKGAVNINKASEDDLRKLPGIDEKLAERIIANRPYREARELMDRRLISKAEYNRIATQIVAR